MQTTAKYPEEHFLFIRDTPEGPVVGVDTMDNAPAELKAGAHAVITDWKDPAKRRVSIRFKGTFLRQDDTIILEPL